MKRKNSLYALLIALSIGLCSHTTLAQETASEDSDGELESFFAISLIGGVTESNLLDQDFNRIDVSQEFLDINVEIQLRWRGLFYENPGNSQESVDGLFSGDAIGYNVYNSRNWGLDIYAVNAYGDHEFFFGAFHEKVNQDTGEATGEVVRTTLNRDRNHRLGLRATGYFSDYLAQIIVTPFSFESEIGGLNLSASLRRTWLYKNWNFYGTVGLNYQSSDILDYYWGLTEAEVQQINEVLRNPASPYEAYDAGGGLFAVAQAGFEYPISENLVFGGYVTTVARPDAIKESPLSVEGRFLNTAGLSVTYVF